MRTYCLLILVTAAVAIAALPTQARSQPLPAHAAAAVPLMAQSAIQDFGAVIDIRRIGADGAVVMAVTPGGNAERMGLRGGDRIVSINGQPISASNTPAAALRSATSGPGRALHLEIIRDDVPMVLRGSARETPSPTAASTPMGCGYVSTSGAHPRVSQQVFPAEVTRIDGRSTPLFDVNRHRVDAGRRVLVVDERIDATRFSAFTLQERQRQLRRQGARRYKVLIVDVAPDTRYEIGARLLTRSPDTGMIRDNTYWEPVVWRQTAETCR
ncbi:PDZ domain-containing protein [Luteimonas aestuarii]|uniref:PDZ domain-containing protein n=1 Tax=Luteimonas aestuarii TaxID=453837 RepID=A0A4R5U1F1_9GAMM|nr:PDZ domain-containing protein [Luteimonas aestuarii]TDK27430.1 PDZ domain-containing protein [Luteimonas aestuarii]